LSRCLALSSTITLPAIDMAPFHSPHTSDHSVRYSTVETNADYDRTNRASVVISDFDGITSSGSTVVNSESSRNATDKAPKTYEGPAIEGWPAAPQQLRGFSVPLLVGDIILILLPIAFLGM
jgi:hypothetical protein